MDDMDIAVIYLLLRQNRERERLRRERHRINRLLRRPEDAWLFDDPIEKMQCSTCNKMIEEFRYKCFSCHNITMCSGCATTRTHSEHYVLRVPKAARIKDVKHIMKPLKYNKHGESESESSSDDSSSYETSSQEETSSDENVFSEIDEGHAEKESVTKEDPVSDEFLLLEPKVEIEENEPSRITAQDSEPIDIKTVFKSDCSDVTYSESDTLVEVVPELKKIKSESGTKRKFDEVETCNDVESEPSCKKML